MDTEQFSLVQLQTQTELVWELVQERFVSQSRLKMAFLCPRGIKSKGIYLGFWGCRSPPTLAFQHENLLNVVHSLKRSEPWQKIRRHLRLDMWVHKRYPWASNWAKFSLEVCLVFRSVPSLLNYTETESFLYYFSCSVHFINLYAALNWLFLFSKWKNFSLSLTI